MDPGKIGDLLQIAGRHNGRILFQRTEQRGLITFFWIDGQVNKRRGGVVPALEAHPVGENRHHAPCSCRYPGSHLLQQGVGVDAQAFGDQLFFGTEGIAEPAHRQTGKKADRFGLDHSRNDVRVNAYVHLGIDNRRG